MIKIKINSHSESHLQKIAYLHKRYDLFKSICPSRLIFSDQHLIEELEKGINTFYMMKNLDDFENEYKNIVSDFKAEEIKKEPR